MKRSEGWKQVGKVQGALGLKGHLKIYLVAKEAPWISQLKTIALSSSQLGEPLSYQVQEAKFQKDILILRLKGVEDRTAAEKIQGSFLYIPEDLLISKKGESIFLREILGFEVVDRMGHGIGKISGFSSNGAQDLIQVQKQDESHFEAPFVEAFLVRIDFEKKQVVMNLPEGLWD